MSDRNPSSRWPKATALAPFYGNIALGDDGYPRPQWEAAFLVQIMLPFPMRRAWDTDSRVRKITCHREVKPSLSRVFDALATAYPDEASRRAAGIDCFGGCFEYRAQRGTQKLSMHAYGAAFDFSLAPGKELPPAVVEIFKREGWAWGGDRKEGKEQCHMEAIDRR